MFARLIVALIALTWAMPTSAQIDLRETGRQLLGRVIVDTANREMDRRTRTRVVSSTRDYNAESAPFDFRGARFEIELRQDQWSYYVGEEGWLEDSIVHLLSGVGAVPVWNHEGIRRESDERDDNVGNRWINPDTKPAERTISVAKYRAEVTALMADRQEDLGGDLEQLLHSNLGVSLSREVRYAGLIVKIRHKDTGHVLTTFKVIGTASQTNHASLRVGGGLFGDHFDADYGSNGNVVRVRAAEDALRQMRGVLERKNQSRRDHP